MEDSEDFLEFDINVLKVDDEINCVRFLKKQGEIMKFHESVNLIK